MTYDQAQSPRLGQRSPVESTYVQIVDVTPANPIEDLVEATWPGMLVFRNDLSQLHIYDGAKNGWRAVAGGIAGQVTYVGESEPLGTAFNVGDVWYDSDDGYQPYVWDGDSWNPASTGEVGNRTYYETGFIPHPDFDPDLPADPVTNPYNLWVPLTPGKVGVSAFTIGDVWYQTDDGNHPYRWGVNEGVTEWVDVVNPAVSQTGDNTIAITELGSRVNENSYLATSANNTADTADGRVSMSDYQPGPDDVTYDQKRMVYDPATETVTEITEAVPRENGSIWFTRTRPRTNQCANPSLETDDVGWAVTGGTGVRDDAVYVPAGEYTYQVTNSAVTEPHTVSFGAGARITCKEEEHWAASVYAELITPLDPGVQTVDVTLELVWHDAAGTPMTPSVGDPYRLVTDSFNPTVLGTSVEPRVWVTDQAPIGAVSFYVREVCQSDAVGIVWHTGAMLIEQEDDLGRYFDGDSLPAIPGEASWDGAAHGSISVLRGEKIQEIWELRDRSWNRKFLIGTTISDVPASKVTGQLGRDQLGTGVVSPDKHTAKLVKASEALLPGELVHVWNDGSGEHKVRRADALNRYEAHGFVWNGAAIDGLVAVYHTGYIEGRENLAPGLQWLSPTPGQVTNQPPSAVGSIVQRVGFSPNPEVLDFQPGPAIRIT